MCGEVTPFLELRQAANDVPIVLHHIKICQVVLLGFHTQLLVAGFFVIHIQSIFHRHVSALFICWHCHCISATPASAICVQHCCKHHALFSCAAGLLEPFAAIFCATALQATASSARHSSFATDFASSGVMS